MIEKALIEMLKDLKHINTLSNNIIYIKRIDQDGVEIIDDQAPLEGVYKGYQQISFNTVLQAWYEFISVRRAKHTQFVMTSDFSTFNMALMAKLPFVEVDNIGGEFSIWLREFKTNQLPAENYENFEIFLGEVMTGKYEPAILSEQTNDNLYHHKSRSRQDLRLIGLLNEDNEINQNQMNLYKASNKTIY